LRSCAEVSECRDSTASEVRARQVFIDVEIGRVGKGMRKREGWW
jgi:hypothetical protein